MNNEKILEAIAGLIPDDVRDKVSNALSTVLKEAVAELEKEYSAKLEEGYQKLNTKREEENAKADKVAEEGYAQAYAVIDDLKNRLEVQKQEFEAVVEEEHSKAYKMLQEERNKNKTLSDDMHKEYENKLNNVKEWLIDRVDEFLAQEGEKYYEQARRDVLNDPYLAEHRVAFEKVLEVASDFISEDDCMNKTSAKVDEIARQLEHTKIQVRTLESKNMRLMTENNQMKDYVNQTKELVKEQNLNEQNARVEKAKNVEGRGQIVNEPKREVVIGEAIEDAAAVQPINESGEPKTIADQWNFLATYKG